MNPHSRIKDELILVKSISGLNLNWDRLTGITDKADKNISKGIEMDQSDFAGTQLGRILDYLLERVSHVINYIGAG